MKHKIQIHNMKQRSLEWYEIRIGLITGSMSKKVFAVNNMPLVDEMIADKISGKHEVTYVNDAMQCGIDLEPEAIAHYEKQEGVKVTEVGFVTIKDIDVGLSPDGLIYDGKELAGAVEIKCPGGKNHIEYIRTNKVPSIYKYQIYHYFFILGVPWVDFVTYNPDIPIKDYNRVRVERTDILFELSEYEVEILKFLAKMDSYYQQIIF